MNRYVYNQNEWRSGYRYFVTAHAQGDVNGDHIQDHIYLTGQKLEDSPYVTHVTLVNRTGFQTGFTTFPSQPVRVTSPGFSLEISQVME